MRTAAAKGAGRRRLMLRHALRNALVPVVTNISLIIPGVFVGSFLLEIFFSIPGLGREIYLAVNRSDYPVIQAVTIYLAVLTMLINLAADVLYSFVDPRIQLR
jgi:peptide/nickel transport system permease protein